MRKLGKSEPREISKSYICRDRGNMLPVSLLFKDEINLNNLHMEINISMHPKKIIGLKVHFSNS